MKSLDYMALHGHFQNVDCRKKRPPTTTTPPPPPPATTTPTTHPRHPHQPPTPATTTTHPPPPPPPYHAYNFRWKYFSSYIVYDFETNITAITTKNKQLWSLTYIFIIKLDVNNENWGVPGLLRPFSKVVCGKLRAVKKINYSISHGLIVISLQWRHNGRDSVSNHQPHDCLLNRLFSHI